MGSTPRSSSLSGIRRRLALLGRRRSREPMRRREAIIVWGAILGMLALMWGGFAWFTISEMLRASASDNQSPTVLSKSMDIRYPLEQLRPRDTRLFTYPIGPESVRLLLQRDEEGVIRAAFMSCRACYSHRADHHLDKGQLICGRCRHSMRIGDPNEELTARKGCVAVPIRFAVAQGEVLVEAQQIERGFENFAKKQ